MNRSGFLKRMIVAPFAAGAVLAAASTVHRFSSDSVEMVPKSVHWGVGGVGLYVWGVELDQGERRLLSAGASPFLIRPRGLWYASPYADKRDFGPERMPR